MCPRQVRVTVKITNPAPEAEPGIELRQIDVEAAGSDGDWNIRFLVANRGADPLELISVRLPHGQFRAAELNMERPPVLASDDTISFSVRIHCKEPPGLVTENAFVIFLVRWKGERWRIFGRVRVTVDTGGVPHAVTESVTTQKVGFSGIAEQSVGSRE